MERSKAALRGFGKNISPILIGWENDLPGNLCRTTSHWTEKPIYSMGMGGAEQAGPTLFIFSAIMIR
jgi:hypothetical protein